MIVRVTHTDAYGKRWVFPLNCNTEQEQMFRRFLSRLHAPTVTAGLEFAIGGGTKGANREFRATVEHVVLSALRDWTAAGSAAYKPEPLTPPTPTQAARRTTAPPPPPPPEPEEREPYYWENF